MDGTIQDMVLTDLVGHPTISYYKTVADECIALDQGKADYALVVKEQYSTIADEYDNLVLIPQLQNPCGELGYIFAKNAKGDNLREQMNDYLAEIRESGELQALQDYWFEPGDKKVIDLPSTGQNGVLTVGSTCSAPPFIYIVEDKYSGYEIEILSLFAQKYDYGIQIEIMDMSGILPAVTVGKCDIAANSLMKTKEREEAVNFSDTTSQPMYTILMRRDAAVTFAGIADDNAKNTKSFVQKIKDSFVKTFIVEKRWKLILQGSVITLLLTFFSAIIGLILGFQIYKLRVSRYKMCRKIVGIFNSIMGGTPMLVLLMIFYYIIFGKIAIPAFFVAVVTFALNFSSSVSEIYYNCIHSIDPSQTEAALALGYSYRQAFRRFILPQAMLRALPLIKGQIISLLKGTSIVGFISIQDLTKMGDIIRSRTYEAFFPLISVAIIYFLFAWLFRVALSKVEFHIDPVNKRRRRLEKMNNQQKEEQV